MGYVPPGAKLHLQTVANHAERLPGGTAILGWNEIGEPFGWSFIDHAPTRDLALADFYPQRLSRQPFEVLLAVSDEGGLHFVASEAQGVTTPSQDYLLRYLDASPDPTTASRLSLGDTPSAIFLRTPQGRQDSMATDGQVGVAACAWAGKLRNCLDHAAQAATRHGSTWQGIASRRSGSR